MKTATIRRTYSEIRVGDVVNVAGEFVKVLEVDQFQTSALVTYACPMNPNRVRVFEFSGLVECLAN